MKNVCVFDFDGTLTTKDTLLEFIIFAEGKAAFLFGFFIFSPLLVLMKLGLYPNYKAKERLFSYFFKGKDEDFFNEVCISFAEKKRNLLRGATMQCLADAQTDGSQVLVVSASIDNWVRPFFNDSVKVLGTKIEVKDGILTGRFLSKNCYGQEKVNRINEALPDRTEYSLTAYGDSRGDRELLAYADWAFFVSGNDITEMSKDAQQSTLSFARRPAFGEVFRFGIVGVTATLIQYGFYLLLIRWLNPNIANAIAYVISFIFNYIASTKFTFRVKSTKKRGAGFALSHVVNLTLQTLFLSLFLWLGLTKSIAMLPVFCICVPVNFVLVRFFLKQH